MRLRLLVLLVAVGTLALASSGGAVLNGGPDNGAHPYVGTVLQFLPDGGAFICSSAAISPTIVVTAAHCFEPVGGPASVVVSFDEEPLVTGGFVSGTWYPHPDWCNICGNGLVGFDRNDVAVVVLDAPVALSRYAKLPSLGLVDSLPQKTSVDVVGYGIQVRLKTLVDQFLTRHRAPAQLIQSNSRVSQDFVKVSANPAQGKGGACFGDSGGPILYGDTIVGVNSFGANGNCAGVGYSNRVDIAATRDFIDGFLP